MILVNLMPSQRRVAAFLEKACRRRQCKGMAWQIWRFGTTTARSGKAIEGKITTVSSGILERQ